jgi:hypothetical protein
LRIDQSASWAISSSAGESTLSLTAFVQLLLNDSARFLYAEARHVATAMGINSFVKLGAKSFGSDFFPRWVEALKKLKSKIGPFRLRQPRADWKSRSCERLIFALSPIGRRDQALGGIRYKFQMTDRTEVEAA